MDQRRELENAIAELEARRAQLGHAVVGPALRALREQLARLDVAGAAFPEERKHVTVMFADLSGFTALARTLDAERTRELVNACFRSLVPVVEEHGGTVDKFVGDAVLALFGAPVAHENDPERALRSALGMREALVRFNRERGTDLSLHFGIHSGRVVTGGVGAGNREEYSAIGPAVNLAARLEDASEPGEILVGLETWRRTAPLFEFEPLPPLRVKGVDEPVPVFRLLRARVDPASLRGIAGLRSPLVGRDDELARLSRRIEQLGDGRGCRIVISGEAGIGKSRLVTEARSALGEGASWLEARALAHTRETSYGVARPLVRALVGAAAEDPPDAVARALRGALPLLGAAEGAAPYLARLLDVPLSAAEEAVTRDVAADVLRRRIVAACVELVAACARERPLAVVWEDLHWADPSSLSVLEALLDLPDALPLALLLVLRPEEPALAELLPRLRARQGAADWIGLEPLGREASARLLGNLLELDELPAGDRARLLDRAEGNAFFLEELLRSLVEEGVVIVQAGRARPVRAIGEVALPDTLEGVVAARIDRLPAGAKGVLQTAAVIGRVFADDLLQRVVAQGAEDGLSEPLEELLRRAFLRRRTNGGDAPAGSGGSEYIFQHAVTQEVAYGSLLGERRRALHARVGEAIEALWPEQLAEWSATLGRHFRLAGVVQKALPYLIQAGDRARATYANAEALGFYASGLELLREEPPRAGDAESVTARAGWTMRLLESRGDLLELGGDHQAARVSYEEALAAAPAADRLLASRLHHKAARTWESQREFRAALDRYAAAEEVLGTEDPDADPARERQRIDVRLDRLWVHYFLADVAQMDRELEAVRPLVERHGAAAQRSLFFSRRANMISRRDSYVSEAALDDAQAGLRAALEGGSLLQIGSARFLVGLCHVSRGELDEGERALAEALATAERTGDVAWQTRSLVYLAVVSRRRGRVAETRELVTRSVAAIESAQLLEYVPAARANLAWVRWREGDAAAARALGREALELWQRTWGAYPFQWMAAWPLAAAALAEGDTAGATAALGVLLEPTQVPLPGELEEAVRAAAASDGTPAAARDRAARALELAAHLGYL